MPIGDTSHISNALQSHKALAPVPCSIALDLLMLTLQETGQESNFIKEICFLIKASRDGMVRILHSPSS